jgi:hypothetical protein
MPFLRRCDPSLRKNTEGEGCGSTVKTSVGVELVGIRLKVGGSLVADVVSEQRGMRFGGKLMDELIKKIDALPEGKKVAFEADHSDFRGRPTIAMQELCTTDDLKSLASRVKELVEALVYIESILAHTPGFQVSRETAKQLHEIAREALGEE